MNNKAHSNKYGEITNLNEVIFPIDLRHNQKNNRLVFLPIPRHASSVNLANRDNMSRIYLLV